MSSEDGESSNTLLPQYHLQSDPRELIPTLLNTPPRQRAQLSRLPATSPMPSGSWSTTAQHHSPYRQPSYRAGPNSRSGSTYFSFDPAASVYHPTTSFTHLPAAMEYSSTTSKLEKFSSRPGTITLREFKATFYTVVYELELKYGSNFTNAFAFKQLA
jgi:hypothetical protein